MPRRKLSVRVMLLRRARSSFRGILRRPLWLEGNEQVVRDILLVFFFYTIGSMALMFVEEWTMNQSVYFISSTVSTVGYGDIHPKTNVGMLWTCGIMIVGVTLVFTTIRKYVNAVHQFFEQKQRVFLRTTGLLVDVDSLPIYKYSSADVHKMLNYRAKYAMAYAPLVLLLLFAFGVSKGVMGLTMIQSLYFTLSSCTTVGYGDFSAEDGGTRAGGVRAFLSVFLLVLCVVMSNTLHENWLISVRRRIRSGESTPNIEAMLLRKAQLNPRSTAENYAITESEYIVEALLNDKLVDRQVLLAIRRQYHWTARGGDGCRLDITAHDLYEQRKNDKKNNNVTGVTKKENRRREKFPWQRLLRKRRKPTKVFVVAAAAKEDEASSSNKRPEETYDEWQARYWVPRVERARQMGLQTQLTRAETDPFTVVRDGQETQDLDQVEPWNKQRIRSVLKAKSFKSDVLAFDDNINDRTSLGSPSSSWDENENDNTSLTHQLHLLSKRRHSLEMRETPAWFGKISLQDLDIRTSLDDDFIDGLNNNYDDGGGGLEKQKTEQPKQQQDHTTTRA